MKSCEWRRLIPRTLGFGLGLMSLPALVLAVVVPVPGTSDPYLAGMPNGSTASLNDVAPAQSPVLVPGLCLHVGSALAITATGTVSNDPTLPLVGPDGDPNQLVPHATNAENGISNIITPMNSLLGVFLDATQPNLSAAPATLNFTTVASRDYLVLSPLLKQLFFIGNGVTSGAVAQHINVPAGATRLYLGTMDTNSWNNNPGTFTVTVFDPCPTAVTAEPWSQVKQLFR